MATPPTRFSGKNLRKEREKAKLSRFRLSKAIDFAVGADAIRKYESNIHVPNLDTSILLAKALKVSLKKLTDAEG